MLAGAGMITDGIEWPAACYIVAYVGDEAMGVVGVESKIDAALIRSLYVNQSMSPAWNRRRVARGGAQSRAHARRAHLYLFTKDAAGFFERHGFTTVAVRDAIAALPGVPQVEFYRTRPEELAREAAYHLDISADGVIER